ncbi:hypothetical protein [Ruficoccus sp. ZRK36]|uniref:hypothetical protein n=1 Tax=Ruficoccus sp. ZRK36 TaxID=2866311 RepID=UPI001C72DF7A|nr:hypothetical protein [Ruficoccus sp. ZRK36]QYY37367.1 hypothetical protein K0V07_07745 [Ruficoccus sp. ZRK36]
MLGSYDLAVAIYGEQLHAVNRKGKRASAPLPAGFPLAGDPVAQDKAFREIFRRVSKPLLPRLFLIPPRVVLAANMVSELQRRFYKELMIHAGCREILLLEGGMAVALGSSDQDVFKGVKRTYLLCEPGCLELYAIDGPSCALAVRVQAESFFLSRPFPTLVQECGNTGFTHEGFQRLRGELDALRVEKYLEEGLFVWSAHEVDKETLDWISQLNVSTQVLSPECMLDGAQAILPDLKVTLAVKPS